MQQIMRLDAPFFLHAESKFLANHADLKTYSRVALAKAFAQFDPQGAALEKWDITNHHVLQERPWALVSLSHSFNHTHSMAVVGIGLGHTDQLRSIGVDCEWAQRQLPQGWERHILQNEERELLGPLTPLEIWCAKEAAFKALWPLCQLSVVKEVQLYLLPDRSKSQMLGFQGPSPGDTGFISWEKIKSDDANNVDDILFTKAWCPHV